jgi:flagellar basal body L-ring protein FlgH
MRRLLAIITLISLTGCASISGLIPSFWDDNQSARITDVRLRVEQINCDQPQLPQALQVQTDLRWFELYSDSKGARQQDVIRVIAPMQESVSDWVKRSTDGQGSKGYCEIKKKLLQTQAKSAASAILGRF